MPTPILSSLTHRWELVTLIPPVGTIVEVGTHRGAFAHQLLSNWGGTLHCVDPWTNYDPAQQELLPEKGRTRNDDYLHTLSTLLPFNDRVVTHKITSEAAAPIFPDASLDLVYLDGDHSYDAVRQDLELWFPKIKPGGILAGHDIICPGAPDGDWSRFIFPAVYQFCTTHNRNIYLINEYNQPWSYYIHV